MASAPPAACTITRLKSQCVIQNFLGANDPVLPTIRASISSPEILAHITAANAPTSKNNGLARN